MTTETETKIYGMLLESVHHYLLESHGDTKWDEIRTEAGITSHTFITHQKYPENSMRQIAEAKAEVLREEGDMAVETNMRYFGRCFVKFFTHYGYDKIIRVSGRHLRDFFIGIDSLHEHMRFGYPMLQSPMFYCNEETSSGLTLHYTSKRKGYMHYVVGQVEEVAKMFYNIDVDIKILDQQRVRNVTHVAFRLSFDNTGYKPVDPAQLSISPSKSIPSEIFFHIFPFSFAINCDMTISMAGSGIIATIGNGIIGRRVQDAFTLRRPKTEFNWESVCKRFFVLL